MSQLSTHWIPACAGMTESVSVIPAHGMTESVSVIPAQAGIQCVRISIPEPT
jgi:hypothetical protein